MYEICVYYAVKYKYYGLLKCDTRVVRYMDTMFQRNVLLTSYGFTLKMNKTDSLETLLPSTKFHDFTSRETIILTRIIK